MKNISKAVLYPFNKITRGLINYKEFLNMEIKAIVDFTYLKIYGQNEAEYNSIGISENIEMSVQEIDAIILNDPVIPMEELRGFCIEHNVIEKWKQMILSAKECGVRVVGTHIITDREIIKWLEDNGIEIEYFAPTRNEIHQYIENSKQQENREKITKTAIFGTQSCIGKYSSQMYLYKELLKKGERTKLIITEPTGFLFGQPQIAGTAITPTEVGMYAGAVARTADYEDYDHVIFADQADLCHKERLSFIYSKIAILREYRPDRVFLVCGYDDDEQIRDCIDLLRIYGNVKPFALLIPDKIEVMYMNYMEIEKEKIEMRKNDLKRKFNIENVEEVRNIAKFAGLLKKQNGRAEL